jgi:hypothetical protein
MQKYAYGSSLLYIRPLKPQAMIYTSIGFLEDQSHPLIRETGVLHPGESAICQKVKRNWMRVSFTGTEKNMLQ